MTKKDHFSLSFIDQMLERLGHAYYSFLDGYSRYNQIPIAREDQKKTTLIVLLVHLPTVTCPLGYAIHCYFLAVYVEHLFRHGRTIFRDFHG